VNIFVSLLLSSSACSRAAPQLQVTPKSYLATTLTRFVRHNEMKVLGILDFHYSNRRFFVWKESREIKRWSKLTKALFLCGNGHINNDAVSEEK
jgi:hypothetical protein